MLRGAKRVVIIGAGISGVTAAKELVKQGYRRANILILEKSAQVGGKLSTYKDEKSNLVTERGAGVFTANYPIINWMAQLGIQQEYLLPTKRDTVSIHQHYDQLSIIGTLKFSAELFWEQLKMAKYVWDVNTAKQSPDQELPITYQTNFKTFAEAHHLPHSQQLIEHSLWTGFGYGSMGDQNSYAFRVLEYMGYLTLPCLTFGTAFKPLHSGYQAVQGGYQQVVEKMAEEFEVHTSITIKNINRKDGVKLTYERDGQEIDCEADLLILATSPYHWQEMRLDLTEIEQECIDKLSYYPYPVAICRIHGFPAEQIYIEEALPGHPAFLNTRDNRTNPQDGRLFTVYINGEARNIHGDNPEINKEQLKTQVIDDLRKLAEEKGFQDFAAEVIDIQIWEDYNPTLPWDVGTRLQQEETTQSHSTIHLTTCLPGNFEIVSSAMLYAEHAVRKWCGDELSYMQKMKQGLNQMYHFFYSVPRKAPIDDEAYQEQLRN